VTRSLFFDVLFNQLLQEDKSRNLMMMCSTKFESSLKNYLKNSPQIHTIYQHYFGDILLPEKSRFNNFEKIPHDGEYSLERLERLIDSTIELLQKHDENEEVTNLKQKLRRIIQVYEGSKRSNDPVRISTQLLIEFISTHMRTFSELQKSFVDLSSNQSPSFISDTAPFDDIERYIAISLLRVNEVVEQALEDGEFNIIVKYVENLAHIWLNVLKGETRETISSNKKFLMMQTSFIFSKLNFL